MHEDNFAWRNVFGVFDQRFTRRVCTELELFDVAANALGRFIGI